MDKKPRSSLMNRSRVSNGTGLFIDSVRVDGRSVIARRYRDLIDDLLTDIGGNATTAQTQLVRRAAGLAVECELFEARIVAGEPIDTDAYVRLTGALTNVLRSIGINRPNAKKGDRRVDSHTYTLMDVVDA